VYSNRQAPSRDACSLFAEQDNVKHVVSGGTWHDPNAHKWVKVGPGVLEYFNTHPHQRRLLGFPNMEPQTVGENLIILFSRHASSFMKRYGTCTSTCHGGCSLG
jgi:hypothetical protein